MNNKWEQTKYGVFIYTFAYKNQYYIIFVSDKLVKLVYRDTFPKEEMIVKPSFNIDVQKDIIKIVLRLKNAEH